MFQIKFISGELLNYDPEDISINEAIQSIYDIDDEIVLNWNGDEVCISLNYDIGESFSDILKMIDSLNSEETEYIMKWPSQTFWVTWNFKSINKSELQIEAFWNKTIKPIIRVNRYAFIKEWEKVVIKIKEDLKMQGYNIEELTI